MLRHAAIVPARQHADATRCARRFMLCMILFRARCHATRRPPVDDAPRHESSSRHAAYASFCLRAAMPSLRVTAAIYGRCRV